MHIGQALDLVSRYEPLRNPLTSLADYLDPELISRCLVESGTVTLRKRRLPLGKFTREASFIKQMIDGYSGVLKITMSLILFSDSGVLW